MAPDTFEAFKRGEGILIKGVVTRESRRALPQLEPIPDNDRLRRSFRLYWYDPVSSPGRIEGSTMPVEHLEPRVPYWVKTLRILLPGGREFMIKSKSRVSKVPEGWPQENIEAERRGGAIVLHCSVVSLCRDSEPSLMRKLSTKEGRLVFLLTWSGPPCTSGDVPQLVTFEHVEPNAYKVTSVCVMLPNDREILVEGISEE